MVNLLFDVFAKMGCSPYYLHNKEKLDAYMERLNEEREQRYQEWLTAEPSPAIERLRAIRDQRNREQVRE